MFLSDLFPIVNAFIFVFVGYFYRIETLSDVRQKIVVSKFPLLNLSLIRSRDNGFHSRLNAILFKQMHAGNVPSMLTRIVTRQTFQLLYILLLSLNCLLENGDSELHGGNVKWLERSLKHHVPCVPHNMMPKTPLFFSFPIIVSYLSYIL